MLQNHCVCTRKQHSQSLTRGNPAACIPGGDSKNKPLQVDSQLIADFTHHAKVDVGQRKVNAGPRWIRSDKDIPRMRVGMEETSDKELLESHSSQLGRHGVGVDARL